jgi:ABC-type multidrug transport system ATPase subunit
LNPPMYFLEVAVENVRCFGQRQVLDLRDRNGRPAKWTVILGDNGVGKTTLLQCLYATKLNRHQWPQGPDWAVPSFDQWPSEQKQELRRLSDQGESLKITAQIILGDVLMNPSDASRSFSVQCNEGSVQGVVGVEGSMFCCGYGAARRPGRAALSADSRPGAGATLLSDSAELINVEEWLLQADYSARSGAPGASGRFNHIRETILRLLKESVSNVRVAGLDKVPPQPVVQFETPYGWVRPHQLSLGYKAMLSWVLDLASRMFESYPDSVDPLSEPAVVLVDEIDLHLHPRWQRDIVSFLSERFRRTQFIVTAHSPLIVQAAADANLVVLRRAPQGEGRVLIENDPEIVRGWRVDQLLTSELFDLPSARPPELTQLLARRGVLLEQASRTSEEEQELVAIEQALRSMPTGETPEDRDAERTLRWFAEQLRKEPARS